MQIRLLAYLLLILALTLQPAAHGDDTVAAPATATSSGEPAESHALRTGLAVTGGCVGGAVLGTVIPIFGNLVGCAVGGIAGWWFGGD